MKKLTVVMAIIAMIMALPGGMRAVTPDELEQAQTYAAIIYLRNANNGADYLDKVSAPTRSALAGKLHDKEKENLRLFNSKLPSASGYESWGMKELVAYAQKAVRAPGNYSSPGYAANQVAKRVNQMKLTPPKTTAEEKPSAELPEAEQPQRPAADTLPAANVPTPFDQVDATPDTMRDNSFAAAEDSLMSQTPNQDANAENGSNTSTFYIIVLVVLVILVAVLVIYAARYFKRQGNADSDDDDDEDDRPAAPVRSRHTERAAGTDAPLAEAERTIASLRAENAELRRAIEEYKYHLNYLKAEKEKADTNRLQTQARTTVSAAPTPQPATTLNDTYTDRHSRPTADKGPQRVIYLGRSNREGMFIRAERTLNPQHSVFRLVTTDNLTGTYSVAEDSEVEERILANPELLLGVSCDVVDMDTYGKEAVATEIPGKAIFENGRWRVLRPAKVKFV